ncbi:MAG: 50S ribosomal protein L35 [Candidatus Marinimicrobia bacterium]|nr:50S ribosomal protein L35 [Candidatus Neomarinimicrobiota bacterium]|tara:strand:- start:4031 stop:4225 length:195 start_codon:yes stop_codon:yes gene_type:complete
MPKMKTKRNAVKRFKVSGSGKVKRFKAGARHLLTRKSPKRKRRLRKGGILTTSMSKRIQKLVQA